MGSRFKDIWRSLKRDKGAWIGLSLVALVVGMAVFGPLLAPYGPEDRHEDIMPPSGDHLMGTDGSSYDVWSRLLYGARLSLITGLSSVGLALLIGIPMGAVSGYAGGKTDSILMRVVDVMLAFPSVVLAIAIATLFAERTVTTVIVAVGIVNIPTIARQVRASVLQVRGQDYVVAARSMGFGPVRILMRHILPNCLAPILVLATLGVGHAILAAAGLNFLGLGAEARVAEWGVMLRDVDRHLVASETWVFLPPGLAIAFTVLGFNLLGDGLRKALDPRTRGAVSGA